MIRIVRRLMIRVSLLTVVRISLTIWQIIIRMPRRKRNNDENR